MIVEFKNQLSIPQVAPLPRCSEPRLIDAGLVHREASVAGYAERYRRGETTHTLHVWWARRPHTAMRVVAFAALCKESSPEAFEVLRSLSSKTSMKGYELSEARKMMRSQYSRAPKVLDMFGGGGTIPLEAANLGAQAYSIDSNQLSVFIQKCNLVHSQDVDLDEIRDTVRKSGIRVLSALERATEELYPLRRYYHKSNEQLRCFVTQEGAPYGYIWTYSVKCPNCRYRYYLSKRPWLSRKGTRRTAVVLAKHLDRQKVSVRQVSDTYRHNSNWIGRTAKTRCPRCGYILERIDIRRATDELIVVVRPDRGPGKRFSVPPKHALAIPSIRRLRGMEKILLDEMKTELPQSPLPTWSGIVNPSLYGVETYSDFLNPRQRLVLLLLLKYLKKEYEDLLHRESEDAAKFVICVLSSLVDQLIDWNCRLSMWISQNEQVGRAFCGPGIAMLWDYVEIDPVLNGPANLWGKLDRIITGISSIARLPHKPIVKHGYAQNLPFQDGLFDAIVTDPPYYDNLYYSVLADFFYTWKRILLRHIEPELFNHERTDSAHELVASTQRNKTPEAAHEIYCYQLTRAVKEAARVLNPKGVLAFVYTHSSLKGWEALVRAFRDADFLITSVEPLTIERRHRPRAMSSEAVNTCVVFVARKAETPKTEILGADIARNIASVYKHYALVLADAGWQRSDVALAIFAHGVGYLCNASGIRGMKSDEQALRLIASTIAEFIEDFKIKDRAPL